MAGQGILPRLEAGNSPYEEPRGQVREFFSPRTNHGPMPKISLATTYLNDTTDSWFQGWSKSRGMETRWIDFAKELCKHFGERNMADVS